MTASARDDILEGLNDDATGRGDASIEVQDRGMHALFALETEVAIGHLHGYGDEDRVAGHAQKIRPIVHVNLIANDADGDEFGEILEAFWRALDAEVAIEICEFIHACGRTAERHGASGSVGVCEATSPGGSTQEFAQTRACNRDVCESVFFTGVSRDVVFAGTAGVHKFDLDIFANAFQMTITPHLPGRSCCRTASLFRRTIVGAASGMRFNLIRWTPNDVNAPAICIAPGYAGGKVFVGVGQAAVVLFPGRVIGRVGFGIALLPEYFDELFALLIGGETEKGKTLCLGDNFRHLVPQPVAALRSQFFEKSLIALLEFFGTQGPCRVVLRRRLVLSGRKGRPRQADGENNEEKTATTTPHDDTSLENKVRGGETGSHGSRCRSRSARYPSQNRRPVEGLPERIERDPLEGRRGRLRFVEGA